MPEYRIVRTRRKTAAIMVRSDTLVEIRGPLHLSDEAAESFFSQHRDWVFRQQERLRERGEAKQTALASLPQRIIFRGRAWPVELSCGKARMADGVFLIPDGSVPDSRKKLESLCRDAARNHLKARALELARQTGLNPKTVTVNSARTHWGACSPKNAITLSWRLAAADDGCIDYVIVHELAHTVEHNHSPRFWALVAQAIPDYKQRRKRLREYQKLLENEGWF